MDTRFVGIQKFVFVLYTSILFRGLCALLAGIFMGWLFHLARQTPTPEAPLALIGIGIVGFVTPYLGYTIDVIKRMSGPVSGAFKFDFLFWFIMVILASLAVFGVFFSFEDDVLYMSLSAMMFLCLFNVLAGMSIHAAKVYRKQSFGPLANILATVVAVGICFAGVLWVGIPLVQMTGNQPGAIVNFLLAIVFAIAATVPLTLYARRS